MNVLFSMILRCMSSTVVKDDFMYKGYVIILIGGIMLSSCENSPELEVLQQANGTGAAEYFGPWVSFFSRYLFWIYAVVFFFAASIRGINAIVPYFAFTVIFAVTFLWDQAPGRAYIFSYYICTPLLYIPFFSNNTIRWLHIGGSLASLIYIAVKAWHYEGLIPWTFDVVIWGLVALFCMIFFEMELDERCPFCGYLAVSPKGMTQRYNNIASHFSNINNDGMESNSMSWGNINIEGLKEQRCGHCLKTSKKSFVTKPQPKK